MKTWLMELCPEIAEWQADAIEAYHESAMKLAAEDRNFCERCGKRLGAGIHTCTPPQEDTVATLNNALAITSAGNKKLEAALDAALEALESCDADGYNPGLVVAALVKIKEVRP